MAYLDKQNADFKDFTARQNEAIASKDAEIDQLRAEIESLKKNISGLSDRLAEAEENAGLLDAAEEHAAELEARLEEANGQIFALQSKIADQTVQIAEKEGMIARLSENDPATSSEKDRKAGLYDDMSSQIGDLLIAANKSADDIVSEAKTKAGKRIVPICDRLKALGSVPKVPSYPTFHKCFREVLPNHMIHDARHTFVTMMTEAEIDLRIIQTIVGHSKKSSVADIYTHITLEKMTEAVNRLVE
jgi:chromosome segregation ATPase